MNDDELSHFAKNVKQKLRTGRKIEERKRIEKQLVQKNRHQEGVTSDRRTPTIH
jgi:hypothetical protein